MPNERRPHELVFERKEEALALLDGSIQSFSKAGGHVDPDYRAQAFYERSKAYYRRYAVGRERKDAEAAVNDGDSACKLASDTKFQTCIEYLQRIVKESLLLSQ